MSDDWQDDEYLRKLDGFLHGGESTTLMKELTERGWRPLAVEELDDESLSKSLTNLIWSLADLQVSIEDTDHLPDRELYILLLEYCHEPTVCFAGIEGARTHWSPIGSGSEEDNLLYLKYYADEEYRQDWLSRFPEEAPLPESELPPYPRPWIPSV